MFLCSCWCKRPLRTVLVEQPSTTDSCAKDPDLACMCFCFGSVRKFMQEAQSVCLSSMVILKGVVLPKINPPVKPDEGKQPGRQI